MTSDSRTGVGVLLLGGMMFSVVTSWVMLVCRRCRSVNEGEAKVDKVHGRGLNFYLFSPNYLQRRILDVNVKTIFLHIA